MHKAGSIILLVFILFWGCAPGEEGNGDTNTVPPAPLPVISITAPAEGTVFTGSMVLIQGTATVDSPSLITSVQLQLNGGVWTDAEGTDNWSNSINLTEGSNIILARAVSDQNKTNLSAPLHVLYTLSIYVSTAGNDAGSGLLPGDPLLNFSTAISLAKSLGITNIRAAAGIYTPGAGLASTHSGISLTNMADLSFSGGYDSGFSSQSGSTILQGSGTLYHVLRFSYATNILFNRFVVTGGNANGGVWQDQCGGGLHVQYAKNLFLTNLVVTNNTADNGGGFYLGYTRWVHLNGLFSDNNAGNGGGGYVVMDYFNTKSTNYLSGSIHANTSSMGGGLFLQSTRTWFLFRPGVSITSNANHGMLLYSNEDSFPNTGVVDWGSGALTNRPGNIQNML